MKEYIGVHYNKSLNKYYSKITFNKTTYHCGFHDTAVLAAKARDIAIIKHGIPRKLQILKPLKK